MLEPPLSKGATQLTLALALANKVAPTFWGASGVVAAGIPKASLEESEDPTAFTALTVK